MSVEATVKTAKRWSGIEVFSQVRIQAEQKARRSRTGQLRQVLSDLQLLVVNAGNPRKVGPIVALVQNLVSQAIHLESNKVVLQPFSKDEPMLPRAADVAAFKAETVKDEFLLKHFPELQFWLGQFDLAIKQDLSDQAIKELLARIVFYAGDINAFTVDPQTGLYVPSHKLSRTFSDTLPDEEREKLSQKLYETYVNPPKGVVEVIWDAANIFINGGKHTLSDRIEVRAKPLPKNLVDQYLEVALVDGMWKHSNTHLRAFEMLRESGCILTISRLPHELAKQGFTLADFRREPNEADLEAMYKTIDSNEPFYVA